MCRRILLLLVPLTFYGCYSVEHGDHYRSAGKNPSHQNTVSLPKGCIDDRNFKGVFLQQLNQLAKHGATVKMKQLIPQLERSRCRLPLPPPSRQPQKISEIYRKHKQSVVVFGARYHCQNCDEWHLTTSSGFLITDSGAFITSYHVIEDPSKDCVAAMTADEQVHPIVEVLAADKKHDFAVLQLAGEGFVPLPMKAEVPIGSEVCVISHPNQHYYMVTEGIVSRYFVPKEYDDPNVAYMMVTTGFARGSSGAPVIDMMGNAVGVVSYTRSIYYDKGEYGPQNLQMVFKHATTAQSILRVIDEPQEK